MSDEKGESPQAVVRSVNEELPPSGKGDGDEAGRAFSDVSSWEISEEITRLLFEGAIKEPPHPNQPIVVDAHGVKRFKANPLVRYLLDNGGLDLNDLAINGHQTSDKITQDDHAQFAQLIGYSVSGWSGLSYVTEARCQSVPERGDAEKTYAEGFADGMTHAKELLEAHIRGDYDG